MRLAFALLVLAAVSQAQTRPDMYRFVSGTRMVRVGPNGILYYPRSDRPMLTCSSGTWIERVDMQTGFAFSSICVPVSSDFVVDATGTVIVTGFNPDLTVLAFRPESSAPVWTRSFRGSRYTPNDQVKITVGADGSVSGIVAASATDYSATDASTPAAPPPAGSHFAYFFHLSQDGGLKFATYLGSSFTFEPAGIGSDAGGDVCFGGLVRVNELSALPLTPGTSTPEFRPNRPRALVARFDPNARRFRYIASPGEGFGMQMAVLPGARVALLMRFDPQWQLLILNSEATAAEESFLPFGGEIIDVQSDKNSNLDIAAYASPFPTTANAAGVAPSARFGLMRLSTSVNRLLYATPLCNDCLPGNLARSDKTVFLAMRDSGGGLQPPKPLMTVPAGSVDRRYVFRVVPDQIQSCTPSSAEPVLSWDVRDEEVKQVRVARVSPDDWFIGGGLTGATAVIPIAAQYQLQDVTPGRPVRVLATQRFAITRPLTCADVATQRGSVSINPNPIPVCSDEADPGGRALVSGTLLSAPGTVEIRVNGPTGPLLSAGDHFASALTGNWVGQGMPFFLLSRTDGTVAASSRAYLIPNIACKRGEAPQPAIRAIRDCVERNTFTLAWYGGGSALEIREGSPDGPIVARLYRESDHTGYRDVTASQRTTYWLVGWEEDGTWKPLASTVAEPTQQCEQGRVP